MIQRSELPAVRVGGQWRLIPERVQRWLEDQHGDGGDDPSEKEGLRRLLRHDPMAVPFDRLLSHERMIIQHPARSADEVLRTLAQAVAGKYPAVQAEHYFQKLEEREALVPTALRDGLAVPHIRAVETNPAGSLDLFVLTTAQPVPFGGRDCSLFCLVCTDDLVVHLRLLQKISYTLRWEDLPARLAKMATPEELLRTILQSERKNNDE
jgi:mannitol/fructose-specific phosphotransferase system IIA component (Ntr-type)